jgi:PadR family transcriptional regulator, regulatory protein PadR
MTGESPQALLYGTLDVLVLKAVSSQSMHGYAVSVWIQERTNGVLTIDDAALYKALHRLEASGAIAAEWGLSENNRRAKYYRLTAVGRQRLVREASAWRRYAAAVFVVLETA